MVLITRISKYNTFTYSIIFKWLVFIKKGQKLKLILIIYRQKRGDKVDYTFGFWEVR